MLRQSACLLQSDHSLIALCSAQVGLAPASAATALSAEALFLKAGMHMSVGTGLSTPRLGPIHCACSWTRLNGAVRWLCVG